MDSPLRSVDSMAAEMRIDVGKLQRDADQIVKTFSGMFKQAAQAEAKTAYEARQRAKETHAIQMELLRAELVARNQAEAHKQQIARDELNHERQLAAQKEELLRREQVAADRARQRKTAADAAALVKEQRELEKAAAQRVRLAEQTAKAERRAAEKALMASQRIEVRGFQRNQAIAGMETPFQAFSKAVGEARVAMAAFAATAAGFAYVGLRAADNINILATRYKELTGSQRDASRMMAQVERAARAMNLPIRQTQQDFLGLIPAVREAGGNLEQYMNVALRLATLNTDSRGGVEGAIYAIREALSSGGTDLVSLSERFNIPRRALRALIQQTGDFAKALDIVLNQYGATTAAAQAQAQSLTTLSAQIRDTATRTLEKLFIPALQATRDLLKSINEALEDVDPTLVAAAGGVLLFVGGVSAATLALSSFGTGLKNILTVGRTLAVFLKTQLIPALTTAAGFGAAGAGAAGAAATAGAAGAGATAATAAGGARLAALAGTAGRYGLYGAALGAGAYVGYSGVNAVGRALGNDYLANYGLDDTIETLKQTLYIAGRVVLEAVKVLASAFASVVTVAQNLSKSIEVFILKMMVGISDLLIAFNEMLNRTEEAERLRAQRGGRTVTLGAQNEVRPLTAAEQALIDDAYKLNTAALGAGQSWYVAGQELTGYLGRLIELENEMSNSMHDAQASVDSFFTGLDRGFYNILFPANQAEKAVKNLALTSEEWFARMQVEALRLVEQLRQPEGDRRARNFDRDVGFLSELMELIDSGDTDAVKQRLDALEYERRAIEELIPTLEEYALDSHEAAMRLEEARQRLLEINQTIPEYLDALTAATQRALAAAQDTYLDAVSKAEQKRDDELYKIASKTAEDVLALNEDTAEKAEDIREKERKAQADYVEDVLKAENDLRKKLLDIQRNFVRAVTLAASQLDAAGVAAAIQRRNDDLREANEARDEENRKAKEKQDKTNAALQKELDDLQLFYDQRLAKIFAENVKETAATLAAYAEAERIANEARTRERDALMLFYDQRYNDMVVAMERERQMRLGMLATMIQDFMQNTLPQQLNAGSHISNAMNMSGVAGSVIANSVNAGLAGVFMRGPAQGIGQAIFNITGLNDPRVISNVVNQHLRTLAGGP